MAKSSTLSFVCVHSYVWFLFTAGLNDMYWINGCSSLILLSMRDTIRTSVAQPDQLNHLLLRVLFGQRGRVRYIFSCVFGLSSAAVWPTSTLLFAPPFATRWVGFWLSYHQ